MFDLRDLYALPIAISLTLWDAFPIYISVSLALAILTRAIFYDRAYRAIWNVRQIAGVEGLLYLMLFQLSLVPILLVANVATLIIRAPEASPAVVPPSPLTAARLRFGELLGPLLSGCATAAVIKVFAPSIPNGVVIQAALALCGSLLTPGRSGASAIPAVAVAIHLGGLVPATAWIIGAAARIIIAQLRESHRANIITSA